MDCTKCNQNKCCCITPFRYKGQDINCLGINTDDAYDSLFALLANAICELNDSVGGVGSVDHVSFTVSTGSPITTPLQPGQIDTYTIWGDIAETISLGTFDILNGAPGTNGTNGADGADGLDAPVFDWVVAIGQPEDVPITAPGFATDRLCDAGAVVQLMDEDTDDADAYDPLTGIWECPETGYYDFNFWVHLSNVSDNGMGVGKWKAGIIHPTSCNFACAQSGILIDEDNELTAGPLVVGVMYKIKTFVAGDDFTNVGALANSSGTSFVATGTTPTTWTNLSTLVDDTLLGTQKHLDITGSNLGQLITLGTQYTLKLINITDTAYLGKAGDIAKMSIIRSK